MPLVYKILFEVSLMHEFFLTDKSGATPFAIADQQQRLRFVQDGFNENRVSVNDDLQYEFPESLQPVYDMYGLKLVYTYAGYKVAVRVNEEKQPDQSILYTPVHSLPDDLTIVVLLKKKNSFMDSYTNSRFTNAVPAACLFSNEDTGNGQAYPFLTAPPSGFDGGYAYEQGELVSFGANDLRAYFNDGAGDRWDSVAGKGFSNANDRLLVPPSFNYALPASTFETQVHIVLKNYNDDVVQTIDVSGTQRLSTIPLSLSAQDFMSALPGVPFKNCIYTMEVNGSNGYAQKHKLVFGKGVYDASLWGAVCMKVKPGNAVYQLIPADGALINRCDAAGNWTAPPVFEIPIKSRFTYWRYINDKDKELSLTAELQDYFVKDGNVLVSKKPRAIAQAWFLLQKEGSADTLYVPNPANYVLTKDRQGRLCFDIRVPESALFPVT